MIIQSQIKNVYITSFDHDVPAGYFQFFITMEVLLLYRMCSERLFFVIQNVLFAFKIANQHVSKILFSDCELEEFKNKNSTQTSEL